ncbi:MAG: hypothetical protein Q4C47_08115, partial [Planctomycetia bacterium]|nr:hypothetical protein [Planctomycetia bacterium]
LTDRIITSGLLLARPGSKVTPEFRAMQVDAAVPATTDAATPDAGAPPSAPDSAPTSEAMAPVKEIPVHQPEPTTAQRGVPSEESVVGFLHTLAGSRSTDVTGGVADAQTRPGEIPIHTTGYVDPQSEVR